MYQKVGNRITCVIDDKEYYEFLSKFRGCLIFRGKSSLSFKLLDKIFLFLKETFGIETDFLFKKAIIELMPFIGYRSVRLGKKIHPIPLILKKHRCFMLLNKWLLRLTKNKTNVRGLKIDDVCKIFYDALFKHGPIFDVKTEHFEKSLDSRHLLTKQVRKTKGKLSYKKIVSNLKRKQASYVYLNRSMEKLLDSMFFFKSRHKRYKNLISSFRDQLKYVWFKKNWTKTQKKKFLFELIGKNKKKFFMNYKYLKRNNFFIDYNGEEKKKISNTI